MISGQLILLLNFTHGYVLFAANLDDFRSMAKKFMPNKLADELTDMVSKNSVKYQQKDNQNQQVDIDKDEYSDEIGNKEMVMQPDTVKKFKTTLKKRFTIQDPVKDIDFDKLVDRVRVQLEDESKKKRIKHHAKKNTKNNKDESDAEDLYKDLIHKVNQIKQSPKGEDLTSATTQDTQIYDNADVKEPGESPVPENDGMFLKEDDLTKKKDSYEDYVLPKKDNVFESDSETKTTKIQKVASEKVSRYKEQRLKAVVAEKQYIKAVPLAADDQAAPLGYDDKEYEEHKSEEVKAVTGNLFDEHKIPGSPKKLKGTMIPTRHYFKMSSPNYFGKLQAVAEKYDFNEPLPEKDREPENIKYFGNPADSINKKVKVNK